jgi:phage baseplate assembly protein W
MTTPFDKPLIGYRFVQTMFHDTLQGVAARELGDASLWPTIVQLNGLLPPYLTDDPLRATATVFVTGSYLVIPAASPTSLTPDPNGVFLTDLLLDENGLLTAVDGDFATVSGLPNLNQALSNAINTDQGELLYHGTYGSLIRRVLGSVNGPTAALLAAEYAKQAVAADSRIDSVTNSTATISGDVTSVVVQADTVSGKPTTVATKI